MIVTYHRVGRIRLLPALAAAGAVVIVAGLAAATLVVVGVTAGAARLLLGFRRRGRAMPDTVEDGRVIEGVVVESPSKQA